jgi:hypothetical protein
MSPSLPEETQLMDGGSRVQTEPRAGVGRRQLLGVLSGGLAMATMAKNARAQVVAATQDVDPSSLLEKLIDRITYGATAEERSLAQSLGYQGYLEYHLAYETMPEDVTLLSKLGLLTTLDQAYSVLQPQSTSFVRDELIEATVYRAVLSKRQLVERMVELWTDHFNIDVNVANQYKSIDDFYVIRPNAMGTFGTLLNASARSPAMLYYLNNDVSTANNPNENYARELMELHTLGVDAGYTQTDVQEVAKCLTGWTIHPQNAGAALWGTYRYNNATHNQLAKTVLGTPIPPNGGQQDGITVLNLLVNHPATAQFIAKKICRHFLGYNVSQAIINDVASTYTSTGGNIKAMIRTTLKPQYLANAGPKLKRPFHHFVSALRQSGTNVISTSSIRTRLLDAGHRPFNWPTPDGYPDKVETWASNVLVRWNFGASLTAGTTATPGLGGAVLDDAAFFSGATTAEQMADRINDRLFAGRMPQNERDRVRDALLPNTPSVTRRRDAIGLAIGSPSFQWY